MRIKEALIGGAATESIEAVQRRIAGSLPLSHSARGRELQNHTWKLHVTDDLWMGEGSLTSLQDRRTLTWSSRIECLGSKVR